MKMNYHIKHSCFTRKTAAIFVLLSLGIFISLPSAHAEDGVYDILSKTLAPITASLFGGSASQPGAMVAEGVVTEAAGKLAPAQNARLRLAIQAPSKMRADLAYNNTILTACRTDKEMWATPAPLMRTLAKTAGINPDKIQPDTKPQPLIPLAIDPQLLIFLPALFDVKDLGSENIGDTPHRVLQLSILKELRKATNAEDFTARIWITPDHKLQRLIVAGADYSLAINLDKMTFADRFADAAWQAPEDTETLQLPASAMSEIFEKMLGTKIPVTQP